MSGLETAIRNALDRSERSDGQVRARIYQSARQALEAGLRKQGVTDSLVIMEQRKRLEDKIRDIEQEEIGRLTGSADQDPAMRQPTMSQPTLRQPETASRPDPRLEAPQDARPQPHPERQSAVAPPTVPDVSVVTERRQAPSGRGVGDDMMLGGVTRGEEREDAGSDPALSADPGQSVEASAVAAPSKVKGRKAARAGRGGLDVAPERTAKPRRRRGFLSHLITWLVTLAVVGVGCWVFYRSGMVQSILEEAMQAADRSNVQSAPDGPSAVAARGGFTEDWVEIFAPTQATSAKAGPAAEAVVAPASEGEALKITSASAGSDGDVVIEVPAEVLRQMAGRNSTLAVTIQSAVNQPSQLSLQCDFGDLGGCQRHRFTATQEKLDALFKVTINGTPAPNAAGRLIFNSGVDGADHPVFIYSIKALPAQ